MSDESVGTPDLGKPVHQPGDPTPVTDPPHGPVRGCLRAIGEFLLELVGEALLVVLTTASLAAAFVLAELAHRRSPALAYALGAAGVLVVVLGVRQLRRPKERRGRSGRVLAAVTAGLGVWLLLCVLYASLRDALDLASAF
ncbi:hypothetical protein ACFVFS_00400 [Kitasatospora sp. NPDC057692]|uniref:hypothetical protein n=1 Tax=Kitasatospora sp. NPDC057692 TaxID=3346215 RepID=UPI0036C0750E